MTHEEWLKQHKLDDWFRSFYGYTRPPNPPTPPTTYPRPDPQRLTRSI